MSNIEITLPDGSQRSVEAGIRPIDIPGQTSPRPADAAIVARLNGELYDLTRPIQADAALQILTNKDPEALQVYRHSAAHLRASEQGGSLELAGPRPAVRKILQVTGLETVFTVLEDPAAVPGQQQAHPPPQFCSRRPHV